MPCSVCHRIGTFFQTMFKRKISCYFGSEKVKPLTRKKKTENKFTHEEEPREENDAQLPNLKHLQFPDKMVE